MKERLSLVVAVEDKVEGDARLNMGVYHTRPTWLDPLMFEFAVGAFSCHRLSSSSSTTVGWLALVAPAGRSLLNISVVTTLLL